MHPCCWSSVENLLPFLKRLRAKNGGARRHLTRILKEPLFVIKESEEKEYEAGEDVASALDLAYRRLEREGFVSGRNQSETWHHNSQQLSCKNLDKASTSGGDMQEMVSPVIHGFPRGLWSIQEDSLGEREGESSCRGKNMVLDRFLEDDVKLAQPHMQKSPSHRVRRRRSSVDLARVLPRVSAEPGKNQEGFGWEDAARYYGSAPPKTTAGAGAEARDEDLAEALKLFEKTMQRTRIALHKLYVLLLEMYEVYELEDIYEEECRRKEPFSSLLSKFKKHDFVVDKEEDILYYIEGVVNTRAVFSGFEMETFGVKNERRILFSCPTSRKMAFMEEFHRDQEVDPSASFIRFLEAKAELVGDRLNFHISAWSEELTVTFLLAMTWVWKAHKLAFTFDPPATLFRIRNRVSFDPTCMEPYVSTFPRPWNAGPFLLEAQFIVSPGFYVRNKPIVQAQVYLLANEEELMSS